jgi:hypothetical protein
MKSVRIAIMNLHYFREVVKTPRFCELPDDATIIDLLIGLDREYWEKMRGIPTSVRKLHFYDERIQFLLQLLWDPETQRFYDDVGIDTWTDPPDDRGIPIESNWQVVLPPNSRIVLTPNAGC